MSNEFKAKQKQEWDSVAAAWKKWWAQFEKGGKLEFPGLTHRFTAS